MAFYLALLLHGSTADLNVLSLPAPVSASDAALLDNEGFLKAAQRPHIKHFSVDVGVNKGAVMVPWLESDASHFIVGFEANPTLYQAYESGLFNASLEPLSFARDLQRFRALKDRALVVHGAVAASPGTAEFYTGAGGGNRRGVSATGSLLEWSDPRARRARAGEHVVVRKIRLDKVFRHVPPPPTLIWDTLKIDIQGYDVEALYSAGDFLRRFTCIIGEFMTNGYAVPDGIRTDPAPVLLEAGFKEMEGSGRTIWINPRNNASYLANPRGFHCHQVYDSKIMRGKENHGVDVNVFIRAFTKHSKLSL